MRAKRLVCALLAALMLLAVVAMPVAAAVKLPVSTAANKSLQFAKNTCDHDPNCVRYGVENCRRISLHVVFCRIFDERDTAVQGRYTCDKLIRVAVDLSTYRVVVTGNGPYHCA